jgi:trehalose-phosphatase
MTAAARRVEAVIEAIATRLDDSPLVVLLDVDGTLAPIAPTPGEATVPLATRDALRRLVALPRTSLAFVSGRSAEDAWRIAGVDGAWVIGNHGLELRSPDGIITADGQAAGFEGLIADAVRILEREFGDVKGALVEDKRWTLSLHYRLVAPETAPRLVRRAKELGASLGLTATDGRKIVELRPPVQIDKGTASIALANRLGAFRAPAQGTVLYAGDDRTDEDAFRALRDRSEHSVTVRIRAPGGESAHDSSAEFVLESPDELRAILEWLVARRGSAVAPA